MRNARSLECQFSFHNCVEAFAAFSFVRMFKTIRVATKDGLKLKSEIK